MLCITFSENKIAESDEDKPGIVLDYDMSGAVVLSQSKNVWFAFQYMLDYQVCILLGFDFYLLTLQ